MAPAESSPDAVAATVLADAARSTRAGAARLAALARDLTEPPAARTDEARRTRVRAVLDGLVRTIEGRIRRDLTVRLADALVPATAMALGNMMVPVARIAPDADGAVDPELVAVLARRVDEHRLVTQARIALAQDRQLVERPILPALVAAADAAVAAAARSLAERERVRHGRFAEPALAVDDLPPAVRARLTWRIAAAIREWIATQPSPPPATLLDRAVAGAAGGVLAAEMQGFDAVATLLARAMLRSGLADDAGTVAFAVEGHVAAAVAGLALRAGIAMTTAWDMVLDPDGARLVLLLRAAALERTAAAALLLRWPDGAAPFDTIADRMAGYDALSHAAAQAAIDLYRLDPGYVAALQALGGTVLP